MRPVAAILGSTLFFLVAPGTVAGLVPLALTGWDRPAAAPGWSHLGWLPILAGLAVLVPAFLRFALEGGGTPAPVAAPPRLVVGGAYRHVRNPMYVAVLAIIAGQALVFWNPGVLVWGLVAGAAMALFVRLYEEPALLDQHGDAYRDYRANVPAWWPRLTPWRPEEPRR